MARRPVVLALRRPVAVAVVVAAALAACGDGGSSGGGSVGAGATAASSSATPGGTTPPAGPTLLAARLRDIDGSGRASAGDALLLVFDREIVAGPGADPARDLVLGPGDDLGAGASFGPGLAPQELVVRLGTAPSLSLLGTYRPGRGPGPGASPARVSVAPSTPALAGSLGQPATAGPAAVILFEDPDRAAEEQGRPHDQPALATARPFFGNLHAHTGFSDGKDDPSIALAHARAAGLDFQANTDHLEQLSDSTWAHTQAMAAAQDRPGTFAALVGFEWGHGWIPPLGWYNHINVVGTTRRVPLVDTVALAGLYREALATCYPEGAIGIFNHPYINKPPLVFNQWNALAYDGAADKLMALIDCEGRGSAQLPSLGLLPALANGWHVAPAWNQDNHDADWGSKDEGRTGVWLAPGELGGPALLRAIREGRAFSTSDRNARVRTIANGTLWMGSTVATPGPVALKIETDDADGELIARIEVWSEGRAIASQPVLGPGPVSFELTVDPSVDAYFFAHVVQQDGDELFSAPIYVDR